MEREVYEITLLCLQTNRQYFWNLFARSSSSESADEVSSVRGCGNH